MKHSLNLVFLGLLLSGVFGTTHAQTVSTEQWREDLSFISSSIHSHHPDPFRFVSEKDFQRRIGALHEIIPRLKDYEIVAEMFGIVAMLQDGHTKLEGGSQFLSGQYPLRLHAFDDGIFVLSAASALRGALGARLERLGNTDAEEAYRRVGSITSHDNDMTLRNRVPSTMTIPEVLHALNITPDRDRARFVFVDRRGRELILDLAPIPFEESLDWIEISDFRSQPLYLRHLKINYWHEYLQSTKTLYVQFNRVRDAPDETIKQYFARLSSFLAENPVRCIVLDVRFNGGGNGYLNAPIVEWVKSALPIVSQRFYVIIGPGTYSAGQKLVTSLETTTDVTLVGESTGSSPNHFGDAISLPLHHSLKLKVSSVFHTDAPGDSRLTSEPDIWAPTTSADFFSGRDPALEKILSAQQACESR